MWGCFHGIVDPILRDGREYIIFLDWCPPLLTEQAVAEGFSCIRMSGRQFEVIDDDRLQAGFEYEAWTKDLPAASAFEAQIRLAAQATGR